MSSLLSAELAATCNALGYYDVPAGKYCADSNTLETVKDLIRYLRRDDESHDIRRQLGETKVLQTDLLPLLKSYWEETDLFDVLLRLIANLTTPALILWNEEPPTEKDAMKYFLQIEDHLQNYKEAFTDEAVWAVLSTRLSKILEIDHVERGDENSLIIERILILIRNILYVPADSAEKRPDNDASIHDQVLWALHQSGMQDIILYITSSPNEQAYYMHILEILSFMLREQKASELANAALQRSQMEKIRDEAELLAIRHRESTQRQQKIKNYSSTRHSRFGGTFVVKSMKSISDNELIYHKPLNKLDALNFDVDKKKPKTPKNRLPVVSGTSERRSAFCIRLFLKEFCVEFLNGAYNTLMYYVKDNLVRAKAQAHDESYYLWALRFFMEFNRCYKFEVKLVSETMSIQTFHYVQQQSENYFDLIETDKKKLRLWSRRLHLALLAYRELFYTLCAMDKSPDGTVRDSAKVIKNNIFYVLEYREFIISLLITYNELKMSNTYLKDLIETQHIFLKMLESFCKDEGTIMVQRKGRRKNKKRKNAATTAMAVGVQPVEPDLNLEGRWDEAASQLSIVLEGELNFNGDVVPFDAASEVPIDDQKADAMKNVQKQLRNGEFEGAVALLRAAREVWPENDSFGSNNMAPEEEFLALRDIFFADLGDNEPRPSQSAPIIEEDFDDDEEEDNYGTNVTESDFKLEDFIKRLASPKIIRACSLALRNFDKNPVNTNHCIVKLLHRIAFDCKMYVMMFQVSIFQTFQRIFAAKDLPQHKELVKFAVYILRQFFKVTEINKKVFMEALFWKSSGEAYEIEHGYGNSEGKSGAAARVWTEHAEDELRQLVAEYHGSQLDEDIIDWIVNNLIDNTQTRRGVLKKLKELDLLSDYKGRKKSGSRAKIPQSWSTEEETQLRELYERFKDVDEPLRFIMEKLDVPRPKNRIIDKLLVMGLIQDKKELRKKRGKNSSKKSVGNQAPNDDLASSSGSDSEDNSDGAGNPSASARATKPTNKKNSRSHQKIAPERKRKTTHAPASASELTRRIITVMNLGSEFEEALQWVNESLSDAIEDYDESNEGIPLVPIMDYAITAMDHPDFQQMLKALGICEPFNEQETYWRIPAHLSVEILSGYCELLQKAIDKSLAPPEEETVTEEVRNDDNSSDEDVFEKLRSMTNSQDDGLDQLKNKAPVEQETINESLATTSKISSRQIVDSDGDSDDEINKIDNSEPLNESVVPNPKKSSRKIFDSDEESDSNQASKPTDESQKNTRYLLSDSGEENDEVKTVSNKKSRLIFNDSDDETEKENLDTNVEIDSKRIRSVSDSDSEKPVPKRSRVIVDSDED